MTVFAAFNTIQPLCHVLAVKQVAPSEDGQILTGSPRLIASERANCRSPTNELTCAEILLRCVRSRKDGMQRAKRIATNAMTTISSINVKPARESKRFGWDFICRLPVVGMLSLKRANRGTEEDSILLTIRALSVPLSVAKRPFVEMRFISSQTGCSR